MNRFSILIATYNNLKNLKVCLQSIMEQTYQDYEIFIKDGGSKDDTLEFLQDNYSSKVRFISRDDDGIYAALNVGLNNVNGDWLLVMGADDMFCDRDVLMDVAKQIDRNPHSEIFAGDVAFISNENVIIRDWRFRPSHKSLNIINTPPHTATFIAKSLVQKIGTFDESLAISADTDYLIRCMSECRSMDYLKRRICFMGSKGVSSTNRWISFKEDIVVLRRYTRFPKSLALLKRLLKFGQFLRYRKK
jgi:glycosyltransferase involved in cell wall biosynthesis